MPIGTWTEDYKEILENMITNGLNNLKYIENHYTSKNVKFILHFNTNVKSTIEENFDNIDEMAFSKSFIVEKLQSSSKKKSLSEMESMFPSSIFTWGIKILPAYFSSLFPMSFCPEGQHKISK